MEKATAGRDELGAFAPKFAAVMSSGILDSSLKFHLQNAKNHGVTQEKIVEILTHAAFYAA